LVWATSYVAHALFQNATPYAMGLKNVLDLGDCSQLRRFKMPFSKRDRLHVLVGLKNILDLDHS